MVNKITTPPKAFGDVTNKINEIIDNLGTDTSKIFIAIYGTTTYQEVLDAYNAGKIIFATRTSTKEYFPLVKYYTTPVYGFTFQGVLNQSKIGLTLYQNDNSWEYGELSLEYQTNKVTSISSLSTDTQYPSAKCLYSNITTHTHNFNYVNGYTIDWATYEDLSIPSTGSSTSYVRTSYSINRDDFEELVAPSGANIMFSNYSASEVMGIVARVRHDSNSSISAVPYFAIGYLPDYGMTGATEEIIWVCHQSSYQKSGQMLSAYAQIWFWDDYPIRLVVDHRANDISNLYIHPIIRDEISSHIATGTTAGGTI